VSCSSCGAKRGHLGGCPELEGSGGGGGRHRRERGKHRKPVGCPFSWSTRPANGGIAGQHYDHQCGNKYEHAGRHVCKNFNCHETR
jgi:hypothetical protein